MQPIKERLASWLEAVFHAELPAQLVCIVRTIIFHNGCIAHSSAIRSHNKRLDNDTDSIEGT